MPSHPCFRASLSIFSPSPSIDSVIRIWCEADLPVSLTSLARRFVHGSRRRTSSPAARMSNRTSAAGLELRWRAMMWVSFTCMRLWSSWNRPGSPSMSATISPSSTNAFFFFVASAESASTISGNCAALSFPLRVMRRTSPGVANASTRTPSYFGSNVQPSPGTRSPMDAYIGSRVRAIWEIAADLSGDLAFVFFGGDFPATLSVRLLCQTLLFPPAISSIVRPVVTDVMLSATMSSTDA